MPQEDDEEEAVSRESYNPFGLPLHLRPVDVDEYVPIRCILSN
jgi:hypothetical protein